MKNWESMSLRQKTMFFEASGPFIGKPGGFEQAFGTEAGIIPMHCARQGNHPAAAGMRAREHMRRPARRVLRPAPPGRCEGGRHGG